MNKYLLVLATSIFLNGCVSAYKVPDSANGLSTMTFQRSTPQGLGDVSLFLKIDNQMVCKPGQGVTSQRMMAQAKRNNIEVVSGTSSLKVEASEKFRMMAREADMKGVQDGVVAVVDMCDVFVTFKTKAEKNYQANLLGNGSNCSLEILEMDQNGQNKSKVDFSEYQTCYYPPR